MLWTDEQVEQTCTSSYVHSHLRANEQELLKRQLYFGGDLTDDTYLDWILTRAKRFFLILVATGVPDQIFGIIDDSFDDEDLPIIEQAVPELRLSYQPDRSLDRKFYKTQFRFLTRVVSEGEHIRYADEETVPINPINLKSVVLNLGSDATDRVRLPGSDQKIYVRRRIKLDAQSTEEQILNEIADSRRLCHEHVVSVFGSYLYQGNFNVLSVPAPEYTLKSFLMDTPKSFLALPKPQHRQILINWPHCLASALLWLHNSGEFHGAIRPSNILIDDSYEICFGFLDGDGLLRDRARSDDIEAYQYGPPERWKRAITVQSTGSAAVSLPSGGRTRRPAAVGGRLAPGDDDSTQRSRSASSTSTAKYTYHAASRSKHARLRLSATGPADGPPMPSLQRRDVVSPVDDQSVSSHGTARLGHNPGVPARPPSTLSSGSSHRKKNTGGLLSPMAFVSAPEGRSAVVQTWKSIEQDMFASDVFSLGAVLMDILNLLCKRSYGSFQRHRSSKNRMAGRGGGLADASFHANLGQVLSWAQALQSEAEKKAKKDESLVYPAVGPIVQLAMQCLERDPQARLGSAQLERKLGEHIQHFAKIEKLHCAAEPRRESKERAGSVPVRERIAQDHILVQPRPPQYNDGLHQNPPMERSRLPDRHLPERIRIPSAAPTLPMPFAQSPPSSIATPTTASVSSLMTFNFDGVSDTIVGESPHSRDQSRHRHRHRTEVNTPDQQNYYPEDPDTPRQRQWNNWHNNDSEVDPRLSFGESVETGAFTYLNYSESASSDEGVKCFPRPPTADLPQKPPPNRGLPPVPILPLNTAKPRTVKPKQRLRPKISSDDVSMLNQMNATNRTQPLRLDRLQQVLDYDDDDYHDIIKHARRPHTAKVPSRNRMQHEYYQMRGDGTTR
jgi:serine/threonine protein kinase